MENKVVCYYCGTIYSQSRGKCPLCGSSTHADEPQPVRRERLSEQQRRQHRRTAAKSAKGKYSSKKTQKSAKGLLTAALIFLALTVLVVGVFIGDMIGWWGGLEDRVDRSQQTELTLPDTSCSELTVSAASLEFGAAGETAELTASVNALCDEVLYCNSANAGVAVVDHQAKTDSDAKQKSAVFTVTATGAGTTEITFTCGGKKQSCTVTVGGEPAQSSETAPLDPLGDDYTPLLSCGDNASLFAKGETMYLRVDNLPQGYTANWSTADATVAKISPAGELTAIGSGRTTVTAEVGGRTAQVLVRCVFDGDDLGAHLENTDVTLYVGNTFYLYLYDSQGEHITDITYTVGDAGICKAEDGIVTAIARGTTTVTVTYHDKTYECIVRVK